MLNRDDKAVKDPGAAHGTLEVIRRGLITLFTHVHVLSWPLSPPLISVVRRAPVYTRRADTGCDGR